MKYVIVIAEHVKGKSKCIGGYKRIKPVLYSKASVPHPIVYYRTFKAATYEDALSYAKGQAKEMFNMYMLNLASSHYMIMDYTIVLHDIKNDIPDTIFSTEPELKKLHGVLYNRRYRRKHWTTDFLFNPTCSTYTLQSWGAKL